MPFRQLKSFFKILIGVQYEPEGAKAPAWLSYAEPSQKDQAAHRTSDTYLIFERRKHHLCIPEGYWEGIMKQTKTKLLCLLLAMPMLLSSLTACGKDQAKDSNLIKLGDYELLYKGACIMEDSDGNDAIVLTLDFTNNGKENASYLWSVNETVMQNGTELEIAAVAADYESDETVINSQFTDIAPGTTLEVQTAYVLRDPTAAVEATFEQIFGKKSGKITVDPSTLSRVETTETGMTDDGGLTAATGDALLDWWNGAWYGWWKMTGCSGSYESMEGQWWDVCGEIAIGADYTGTITLWDEDYTRADPMALASVSLNEAGTGEHGTVMSEGGRFTDTALAHADWIVDPGLLDYDDLIWIDGDYENGDDTFHYDIYLRPWGLYWEDMDESGYPYRYTDWYLPLIDAGKSMPDAIGEDPSNDFNPHDSAPLTQTDAAASGGDGIVTEEQVQKGYVWMNEVNVEKFDFYKDSFENYKDIEDRVIGGITFRGRTYKYIGYEWIQYIAQLDDSRALSIGLRNLDCVPGTMPDIILNNMTFILNSN